MTAAPQKKFRPEALKSTSADQALASNPESSAWVAASAGTGKTKVLTDRLLRLMLAGSAPEDILCLTYTKAAAAEMAGRLIESLTHWVTLDDVALAGKLRDIGVADPVQDTIDTARRLFARVLDCPGGLKIQTVHSFCQSLLARFPLESNLTPGFTVLEPAAAADLRMDAFVAAVMSQNTELVAALNKLQTVVGDYSLRELLTDGLADDVRIASRAELAAALNIAPDAMPDQFIKDICTPPNEEKLRGMARIWIDEGLKENQERGAQLAAVLEREPEQRIDIYKSYTNVFLTKENELRKPKNIVTKALGQAHPGLWDTFEAEGRRVLDLLQDINRIRLLDITEAYMAVHKAVDEHYARAKRVQNAVDYNDLIRFTDTLLQTGEAWVRYKMDNAITHVLVDEAQDTSPAQWRILKTLTAEFTSGQGAHEDKTRTLFVVGDEKQSIYSFNGADPKGFIEQGLNYQRDFINAKLPFEPVSLRYSFRSVSAVLDAVDAVFTQDVVRSGVSMADVAHMAARGNVENHDCGEIELWDLVPEEKKDKKDAKDDNTWKLPLQRTARPSPGVKLAKAIAARIESWLQTGAHLHATGKRIAPQDILILVQKRGNETNPLMENIVRALKQCRIPVAGVDRLVLPEQLAVEDIMAAIAFVLLPRDDLNLAALLKSPLIGMAEDDLYDVCRPGGALRDKNTTVWDALRESKHEGVITYLESLIKQAGSRPYNFIQHILQAPCPNQDVTGWNAFRRRLGDEVLDPLNELLAAALAFESSHPPTLQGFYRQLSTTALEIKRELAKAGDAVRVMTAHASKGLQAPIVFLADAAHSVNLSHFRAKVVKDLKDTDAPVFYVPNKDYLTPEVDRRQQQHDRLRIEEYRRLLYVALTRAEDRLIICGSENASTRHTKEGERKRFTPELNWYKACEEALKDRLAIKEDADAAIAAHGVATVWRYVNHVTDGHPAEAEKAAETAQELGNWAHKPAPAEPVPAKPLAPGKLSEAAVSVLSPLADDGARFAAGTLTHKLLEVLPDVPQGRRAAVMDKIIAGYKGVISDARLATVRAEVEGILNHDTFAPLFAPGSSAEVPLTGIVGTGSNRQAITGVVDRLVVTDANVLVVDYKTNRPPPARADDVPDVYLRQLAAYRAVLEKVYVNKPILMALLWTDSQKLMRIPDNLLEKYAP
ncbi:MAG: double-strand break repair helicase AddA [Bdellovibrionales bacterium]